MRTAVIGFGHTLILCDLVLTCLHVQRLYLQIRSHSQLPDGDKLWRTLFNPVHMWYLELWQPSCSHEAISLRTKTKILRTVEQKQRHSLILTEINVPQTQPWVFLPPDQGLTYFFCKGQDNNILPFAGHMISVATIQLCCCSRNAARNNM